MSILKVDSKIMQMYTILKLHMLAHKKVGGYV